MRWKYTGAGAESFGIDGPLPSSGTAVVQARRNPATGQGSTLRGSASPSSGIGPS